VKVSEHYVSVQGEGLRTGVFTQFVRFAGCNLRCPGWPCDTPYAIYPNQYKDDPQYDSAELFRAVVAMRDATGANNICITGGEPLIQPAEQLTLFVVNLLENDFTIDLFTNGSKPLPPWTVNFRSVSVMMDWKLRGSGEAPSPVTYDNISKLKLQDGIKFVCTDEEDYNQAIHTAMALRTQYKYIGTFWIGVAAGKLKEQTLNEWVTRDGLGGTFRMNIQVHKFIFPGVTRGV
jgi:7-carboxy-7-deazaguanine synthase